MREEGEAKGWTRLELERKRREGRKERKSSLFGRRFGRLKSSSDVKFGPS